MSQRQRTEALISELDMYRARYRSVVVPSEVDRLNLAVARRQSRVDHLRSQVDSMLEEVSRLEAEIIGCRKGYEALLVDTIERIKRQHREGWSPSPVVGFRLWGWREGGLHGAWQPWRTTSKSATCGRGNEEVPHSDGRCGRLGCGIYAAKDLAGLLKEHTAPNDHGYLAGKVELTGKVVEHEKGYRAARAEVTAAALIGAKRILMSDSGDELDEIFRRPDEAITQMGRERSGPAWQHILEFMTSRKEDTSWTSASKSG